MSARTARFEPRRPRDRRGLQGILRRARLGLLLAGLAFSPRVSAKDDTPDIEALARAHPWHPLPPSTTDVELRCGADATRLELRTARGALYLIAPEWEALDVGRARYLRDRGGTWRALTLEEWLAPRVLGLSLRELVGAPILPPSWSGVHVWRDLRPGAKPYLVRVDVARPRTTLVFDELAAAWVELGGLQVEALVSVGRDRVPRRVRFGDGCTMTRTLREPALPLPSELPGP